MSHEEIVTNCTLVSLHEDLFWLFDLFCTCFVVDFSMPKLKTKIEELGLRLNLLHVGDSLPLIVSNLTAAGRPVVFFSDSLDTLTTDARFTRVRLVSQSTATTLSILYSPLSTLYLDCRLFVVKL